MTEDLLRFTLSPEGEAAIREASGESDRLTAVERLRRRLPPEEATAAVSMALLRKRGETKFDRADRMLFTPDGLEMATGERIARWRARRFAGYARAADFTCGIGGDSIALAAVTETIATDRDPVALRMARRNAEVYEAGENWLPICADLLMWRPVAKALLIDPARRSEGMRTKRGADYQPPLPIVLEWARAASMACVKLSPSFPCETLGADAEIEFISDAGECREAVLWFGEAKTCDVRASLADLNVSMTNRSVAPPSIRKVGAYLYEPDAAVRRAHLIDPLAEEIGAWKLDPEIAYLSSDALAMTPFARSYRVLETFPFRLKELQRRLRLLGAGKVIVKKRGVAYDPAEIEKRLKLDGDATVIAALTRLNGEPTAILMEPAK